MTSAATTILRRQEQIAAVTALFFIEVTGVLVVEAWRKK